MAKNRTPTEIVNFELEQLERLIRNLLVENVNFKTGYYFSKEYTRTVEYVRGPLKEHADHILNRLKGSKEMILDYISDCE